MTTTLLSIIQRLSHWPFDGFGDDDLNAMVYLPIVPSSRLWLPKLGFGDDARFSRIFRNTWRKIELRSRRKMVKHWREDSYNHPYGGLWSPVVELRNFWALTDRCERQPKDLAWCGRNGHSLYFYAPIVDAMPDIHVEELIAHELAHVVLCAIGKGGQTDRAVPRCDDPIERRADEIMEELWGFDPEGMDHWMAANWKWPETE